MTDTEEYVMACITKWVWSGFYESAQVREMVETSWSLIAM